MAAIAEMKHEWQQFKHDHPGERFDNHRRRMADGPTWKKVARAVAGFVLIAAGIVFCVLPGPGTVGIALGLALLAGMSKTIAHLLDRIEPMLRHGLSQMHRFWHELSRGKRAFLISVAAVIVVTGGVVVWRGWLGPVVATYVG